jgi:DNA-binding response OmpR family regulator
LVLNQLNLLIAHAGQGSWPGLLERRLAPHQVGWFRSEDGDATLGIAARLEMHLAVVDDDLPRAGGLDTLRRMRRSGLTLPVLLVASEPDRRLLEDAIELNAFSVVKVADERDYLTPVVFRLVRQVYGLDWSDTEKMN